MSRILTPKQKQVMDTLSSYFEENDESPTLTELQDMLDIKTKRGVVKHLEALERKGFIYRNGKSRGIMLQNAVSADLYDIPILGYANAGQPLVFAEEDIIGSIKVDKSMIKNTDALFALVVKGDSMNLRTVNKVPIMDKNYVIVEKGGSYNNGDVVLAVIDNAATIKTFKQSENSVVLYPESNNPVHTPIYLRDNTQGFINGKVIAVLENPM
jgi:repressor LexA